MGLCFSSPKATRHGTSCRSPNLHSSTQGKAREKVSDRNKKKTKKNKIQWRRGVGIPYGKRIDFGYAKDLINDKPSGYCLDKAKMTLPIEVDYVKREVKILQALGGHENVVGFHTAFEDKSYMCIVMELCEGGELLDRILAKKDSRYTEKDAAVHKC